MFITKDYLNSKENFNWSQYFSDSKMDNFVDNDEIMDIYRNVREYLKEDSGRMGFILYQMLKELFKDEDIDAPDILEIGAASGFLTRSILSLYDGTGMLVDKNEESKKQFEKLVDPITSKITYKIEDLFKLDIEKRFDIVCSFGLIEHFPEKLKIMDVHKKFIHEVGRLLIIVPLDTPLSRAYFEVNPDLNLGYRELVTKKEFVDILKQSNLNILKTSVSFGYSYDFIAALCSNN